jgi:membrane protease YdiL (CAAX protease family)
MSGGDLRGIRRTARWALERRPGTGGVLAVLAAVALWGMIAASRRHAPPVTGIAAAVGLAGLAAVLSARWWAGDDDMALQAIQAPILARPMWRAPWQWCALGAGLAGGMLPVEDFADRYVSGWWRHGPPGGINNPATHPHTVTAFIAAIVFGVLLDPALEEFLCRGCLQSWLGRRAPRIVAIVAISAVFAAYHGLGSVGYNTPQQVDVFAGGLMLAALFECAGALLPTFVAHGTWNLFFFSKSAGLPVGVAHRAEIAACVVGVALFVKYRPGRQGSQANG